MVQKILGNLRNISLDINFDDFLGNLSAKKVINSLILLSYILAAYLIGSSSANLVGALLFEPKLIEQKYVPPGVSNIDRPKSVTVFQDAITGNVFSTEEAPADLFAQENLNLAQESITDFELMGTIVLGFFNSYAYIRQKSKNIEKAFGIGETIFGTNLTLLKVFASYVVLDRNGSEVELKYPAALTFEDLQNFQSPGGSGPSQTQSVAAAAPAPIIQSVEPPSGQAPKVEIVNGKADVVVSSNEIEAQLANFTDLLQKARVVPKSDDQGKLIGYTILDIEKGSFYETIGLKNRDIIKNVNGNSIDSPEKALTLFQLMRNESQINLLVSRGNEDISFNYFIQ